jgi:hypothetical protein
MDQKELLSQLEKKFSIEQTATETIRQENQLFKKEITKLNDKRTILQSEFTILNDKHTILEEIFLESIRQNTQTNNKLFLIVKVLNEKLKWTQSLVETQKNTAQQELFTQFHNHPTHTNNHSSSTQSSRTAGLFTDGHLGKRPRKENPLENCRNVVPKYESHSHPAGKQTQNDNT